MQDSRKVSGRGAYGYIESKWVFNAKKGTPRRRLNRQVYYHVYGDKQRNPTQQQRGSIYDESGSVQRYGDYKNWALGQSRKNNYVFRTHISPKGHLLSDAEFVKAIATASREIELFSEFRLVIHRDTANAHAHMLFASQRQWRRNELASWKVAVRQQLMALERAKCAELGRPLPGTEKEAAAANSNTTPTKRATQTRTIPKRRRRRRRRRRQNNRSNEHQTILPDHEDDGMTLGA